MDWVARDSRVGQFDPAGLEDTESKSCSEDSASENSENATQEANSQEATTSEHPPKKRRKPNYQVMVRNAIKSRMPSLRVSLKHRDADGKPRSRLDVDRQMRGNVLSPYEKEEWHSKDFAEDDMTSFEHVRMMFVSDTGAKKYFGSGYNSIALKGVVRNIEAMRWKLAQETPGGESNEAQDDVQEDICHPSATFEEDVGYDYEQLSRGDDLPFRFKMRRGLYQPEQMKEGTKQAIEGDNE